MNLLVLKSLKFSHSADATYCYDLALEAGEILAISGSSGAGKSTLLDLIAGFLKPASGQILLSDQDITHLPPSHRQVSYLFQKYNLFEHLSVMENICLGLNPNSSPSTAQKQQAAEFLVKIGLHGYAHRPVNSLSGGQMQRVALARELLRDTRLILLDEPFNGLDEDTRDIMLPLLADAVAQKRRSIILVTHDVPDVEQICTRLAETRAGRIHAINDNS